MGIKYNILNTQTKQWMLGESCDLDTASRYCHKHYIARYGDHFEVHAVPFSHADWLPEELRYASHS